MSRLRAQGQVAAKPRWWAHLNLLDNKDVLDRAAELLDASYSAPSYASGGHRERAARILHRLGFCARESDQLLRGKGERVPKRFRCGFAEALAHHAAVCCFAEQPKCDRCPLLSFCRFGIRRLSESPRSGMVVLDLFAGAGALSHGFIRERFRVAAAIESERNAAQTFRHNNPGVPVFEIDVRKVRSRDLLAATGLKKGDVDCIIAGPPCQGFSAAGIRNPRASRNRLYRCVADLATAVGARVALMENVPGLRSVSGVNFEHRIIRYFRDRGLDVTTLSLDASAYGVPQRRHRIVFVGIDPRAAVAPQRPRRRPSGPSVKTVLKGLPRLRPGEGADVMRFNGTSIYNHRAMAHSLEVVRKIRRFKGGEGPISYRRLETTLARTIVAGHRAMPVHPTEHRTITVREAARIQTLPDTFRILGPHANQPLQVANVVPYQFARSLARIVASTVPRDRR